MATKVIVNLPQGRSYAMRVGAGVLDDMGADVRAALASAAVARAVVVADGNTGPLFMERVKAALAATGIKASGIEVAPGEQSKSVACAAELWDALSTLNVGRDGAVVALGGGVVGDLAGFVAATYLRGVPLIQVPTTLLAMVDSSVGGKTALNLSQGKNLVGAFHQPAFVCADTDALSTLPAREWSSGAAELAKAAVLANDDFFFWLAENARALAQREAAVVDEAVVRAVVFKADVVSADERDAAGVRTCLNLGHTLAHAIETVCGLGAFSHGEAVAEGMRFASLLAHELVGAPADFVDAQGALLDALGLPSLAFQAKPEELVAAMKHDKKARGGTVRFVLASDVGQWQLASVDDAALLRYVERWMESKGR